MATKNGKPHAGDAGPRSNKDLGGSVAPENSHRRHLSQAVRAELIGSDRCTVGAITVTGSAPVLALCRQLLAQGVEPDRAMEVFRNGTLALRVRAIGEAARLEINSHGTDFVGRRERRPGSTVEQNERPASGDQDEAPAPAGLWVGVGR